MNLNTIQNSINTFAETPLREASTRLLNTLGYHSRRTGNKGMDAQLFQTLRGAAAARRAQAPIDAPDRLCIDDWENFHLIFQIADDEINLQETLFEPSTFDEYLTLSYIFVALQLKGENYTRTQLADITRFINTHYSVPVMVMFRYGDVLTLAIINRRRHKRDETKRVLEKVTLIKDINLREPHRAHLDILAELHLESLLETEEVRNFDTLHKAWEGVLNTETLNRKFYRELYEWYDWAKSECRFPDGETETQVIRMITRLLFVWFLKEKGLVPVELFVETSVARLQSAPTVGGPEAAVRGPEPPVGAVSNRAPEASVGAVSNRAPEKEPEAAVARLQSAPTGGGAEAAVARLQSAPTGGGAEAAVARLQSAPTRGGPKPPVGAVSNRATEVSNRAPDDTYYKAILQNLFFATLNTPIAERAFSTKDNHSHRDASKYRYAAMLHEPNAFLEKLKQVPFVNGGLFDCLDTFEATRDGGARIDCFTDNENEQRKLHVPDKLFFDQENGIFPLFSRYKFTVEENTPIEQEVALEPELLGRVFENLLGDYNPETQSSARKSTGSYYTPRQIVDYMVDEALIAYFLQKVEPFDGNKTSLEKRLRDDLLAYEAQGDADSQTGHLIHESEVTQLIKAIDELKLLDPAVGSGAFPMGILNKLVLVLKKLDPQNEQWKERQIRQARVILDSQVRNYTLDAIERAFAEENRYNDYGRKLYLIQNCIYGVDIQPIAVTIAKLRFFISLIIEQVPNNNPNDNFGIRPLPNLEIRFVAADTLIGLNKSDFQMLLETDAIEQKRQQISKIRENYFSANTRQHKLSLMREEEACRIELVNALTELSTEWALDSQTGIVNEAQKIAQWNPYDRNAVADFFDAEEMFGVKDGFDIIIGNPPYIDYRHEMVVNLAPALQAYFGDFFFRTADISVYFYKRAAELLKPGGILTYICTNKFFRAAYGKNLRQFLATEMSLKNLLDFGSISVFEAAVDTCIVLAENRCQTPDQIFSTATLRESVEEFDIREAFHEQAFPMQNSQLSSDSWILAAPETFALLEKLQDTGTPLEEYVNGDIYRGLITGYDAAFVIDSSTREQLIANSPPSSAFIKPLLRGRYTRKWNAKESNEYLIAMASSTNADWPWSDAENDTGAEQIFAEAYPAVHEHLKPYREKLIRRTAQGKFYWELPSCSYRDEFEKAKIVYPETAKSLYASYDTAQTISVASAYFIPTADLSLLAILNSTLFDWYARYKFQSLNDAWAGGRLRFIALYMKHFPIAEMASAQQEQLSRWVEQILADPASDAVPALEHVIDELVYEVYGLTDAEIALIKKTYRDAGMELPEPGDLPPEPEDGSMRTITRDDIQSIGDSESLMQFLDEKLGLSIPENETLDDMGPRFKPRDLLLNTDRFSECRKLQVFSGDNSENPEPWVLFLVRFNTNQGYESVLRAICPALEQHAGGSVPFRFICTDEELQPFAFAYFSDSAGGDWQNAELTVFSWREAKTVVHTGAKHELPAVFFPETPSDEQDNDSEDSSEKKPADLEETEDEYGDSRVHSPTRDGLSAKLEKGGSPLGQQWTISRGNIITGANYAFVIEESKREQLIAADSASAQLIMPLIRVPRKKKWVPERKHVICIPSSLHKQWPWSVTNDEEAAERIFADTYPAISEHLHGYKEDLKNPKAKHRGEFYWELSGEDQNPECLPRIIYPYHSPMRACYEESDAFLCHPSFFISTRDLSLLAILNSTLFKWYVQFKWATDGTRLKFKRSIMKVFPVAQRTEEQKVAIAEYVQLILDEPDSHEVPALEEEIDALVYQLYGLTDAEIALIEENR